MLPGQGTPRGRTSRLGSRASDPRQTRSACNGKQHHQPCRSSHGRKREGQTTGAIDTKVLESQSRGCSQALLYNEVRPHSSLGYLTPAEFTAKLQHTNAAPASATGRDAARHGGFAPRPVATPSLKGQSNDQDAGSFKLTAARRIRAGHCHTNFRIVGADSARAVCGQQQSAQQDTAACTCCSDFTDSSRRTRITGAGEETSTG